MKPDQHEDLLVAAMARVMSNGDRVFVGTNQPLVTLAAYLARALWAPQLMLWSGGLPQIDQRCDLDTIGQRGYENVAVAGRTASFSQGRAFEDMGLRSAVVFAGGLQVDARGNANLIGIRDGAGGWALRGPGSAGLPSLTAWARRFYLLVARHEPRSLVERCSAVSVVGDPEARRRLGMPADSLRAVFTPLATFVPAEDGLELAEVAPGVSHDDVAEQTGFGIRTAADHGVRMSLTRDEARALGALREASRRNRGGRCSTR